MLGLGLGLSLGGQRPSSAPAFDPATLTGIVSYFDSRLGVTTSGGDVTDWADQMGVANAITADAAARPALEAAAFGSFPGLRFVPQDRLALSVRSTFAAGISVFAIAKHNSSATTVNSFGGVPLIVLGDDINVSLSFGFSAGQLAVNPALASGQNNTNRGSGLDGNTPHLVGFTWASNGDIKMYSGTTQLGTTFNFTYGTCGFNRIGNGNAAVDGMDGYIGLIVTIAGVIPPGELAQLYALSQSFGVP